MKCAFVEVQFIHYDFFWNVSFISFGRSIHHKGPESCNANKATRIYTLKKCGAIVKNNKDQEKMVRSL